MSKTFTLSVKPIIHYPRVVQVGKTYLMTIDLQPGDDFEWRQDEEDYPIYCKVESELFDSQSVGEPVIILHRFGGSYGKVKFLFEARHRNFKAEYGNIESEELTISLTNRWGININSINLPIGILKKYSSLNSNYSIIGESKKNFYVKQSTKISEKLQKPKPIMFFSSLWKEFFQNFKVIFQNFERRMEASRSAAKWIDNNRENLIDASIIQVKCEAEKSLNKAIYSSLEKAENLFSGSIDEYLDWLICSLEFGEPIDLDEGDIRLEMPKRFYIISFEVMRKEACKYLSDEVFVELENYIDYLISVQLSNTSDDF